MRGISTTPEVLLVTLWITIDDVSLSNLGRNGSVFSHTFVFGQVKRLDSVENLGIGAATGNDWQRRHRE